jgi:type VII secretion integral membrane protein EccD
VDDERCRITVAGQRRRVDLALPARAPIAEYVSDLGRLCGQETDETFPASWSLAPAGARPYPLTMSLREAQVVDGATLYLRDVLEGEADGPLITDIEEIVEEESERWDRWNSRHRAMTLVGVGLGGLLAAVAALILRAPADPLVGLAGILAGTALVLLAGAAARKDWGVPAPLRVAVALTACPVLALTGYAFHLTWSGTSGGAVLIPVTVGVVAGAVAAVLAVPHEATLIAGVLAVVGLPVAVLLAAVDARVVESAAVVGVVALLALAMAPVLAGRLVTLVPAWANAPAPDPAEEITRTMVRGRRVLVTLVLASSLAAAGSLPVLAASDDPYALGLALCLSLAMMAQTGQSALPVAIMPGIGVGAVGLTALLITLPGRVPAAQAGVSALFVCVVAAVVLAVGFVAATQPARTLDERPSWITTWGTVLSVLSVPLAVGVFGVFEYLVGFGGRV